jgi:hypothetical protein
MKRVDEVGEQGVMARSRSDDGFIAPGGGGCCDCERVLEPLASARLWKDVAIHGWPSGRMVIGY